MAWIESHTVLLRHRKLIELAKELRLKPVYVMGHLLALWHVALEQQEDGDLSLWSDEFIAQSSDYSGDAPQYVRLLQKYKWLDGKLLHDWLDYSSHYLISKYGGGYNISGHKKLIDIWIKYGRIYGKKDEASKERVKSECNLTKPNQTKPTTLSEAKPRSKSDYQVLVEYFAKNRKVSLDNPVMTTRFFRAQGEAARELLAMAGNDMCLARQAIDEIAKHLDKRVVKSEIENWSNIAAVCNHYIRWKTELDNDIARTT